MLAALPRIGRATPFASQITINPRDSWAATGPTGSLVAEHDVRFLLVHHTAGSNDYGPDEVPAILRGIYNFHTGPERGWPDVAYNFFVDRYGQAWEGRSGSLAGPVQPDATGGSQGFAQLVCFVGDHTSSPPTAEALGSAVALLAMLADRHAVDTSPGAAVEFVSRGSNRWPAGAAVTAATISGHRDMSQTACPGDAAYARIADGGFARMVSAARTGSVPATSPTTTVPPTTASTTSTTAASTSSTASTSTSDVAAPVPSADRQRDGGSGPAPWIATGAAAVMAAAAGLVAIRRRRTDL